MTKSTERSGVTAFKIEVEVSPFEGHELYAAPNVQADYLCRDLVGLAFTAPVTGSEGEEDEAEFIVTAVTLIDEDGEDTDNEG